MAGHRHARARAGPPANTASALAAALRRAQRLVDGPDGAVGYGARRTFAYALMIRRGIPAAGIEQYLNQLAWLTAAARLLDQAPGTLAAELVESMLRGGSIVVREGRIHAAAEHVPVTPESLDVPFPRAWPLAVGLGLLRTGFLWIHYGCPPGRGRRYPRT